jgi:tripartite-type tricarboxylate transporter receptor subunit TctC
VKALASPEMQRVMDVSGMYAVGSSPDAFAAFLRQDFEYQDHLLGELGLKAH